MIVKEFVSAVTCNSPQVVHRVSLSNRYRFFRVWGCAGAWSDYLWSCKGSELDNLTEGSPDRGASALGLTDAGCVHRPPSRQKPATVTREYRTIWGKPSPIHRTRCNSRLDPDRVEGWRLPCPTLTQRTECRLGKGCGGSRAMTCVVERDTVLYVFTEWTVGEWGEPA